MMFYRGKRARKRTLARPVLLALSLVLVLGLSVGGTLAYLVTNTDPVTNIFTPGEIKTDITEEFDNQVKEDVCIKNTAESDVAVYIRATIVANWVDDEGKIVKIAEKGTDYTDFASEEGWVEDGEGHYYWTRPVDPNDSTGALIVSCEPNVDAKPAGADHLRLTILSQAIQAEPTTAVEEAWDVTVDGNGNLSL